MYDTMSLKQMGTGRVHKLLTIITMNVFNGELVLILNEVDKVGKGIMCLCFVL